MALNIYNQNGVLKATIEPSDSSTHQEGIMADNVLNLSFTLYEFILLQVNDYIDFMGKRFTLMNDYRPEKKSTIEYDYNVKFYGIESQIKNALVLHLTDGENEPSFTLTDNAAAHVRLVVDNINRITGTKDWVAGEIVQSGNKDIVYDCTSCFDALTKIAETFDTEWWIEGKTINLSRCEHGNQIELGYNKGLTKLTKTENENAPFFTVLYPIGSGRNIDKSKYGHSRLRLPGGQQYVELNTHLGRVEYSEEAAFSHIYPRRVGKVGTVRTEQKTGDDGQPFTIYYFTDAGLTFDPNDYEIAGLVKAIVFEGSSELSGYDFEVNFDSKTKEFEIITQFPTEVDQLPGGLLIPRPGDEYVLYNISMPDEYYTLASQELAEAVQDFLEKYSIDTAIYKAPTDYIYFDEQAIDLRLGRRVRLVSAEHFTEGSRDSRVTAITRNINRPTQMDLECSYSVAAGRITQLENNVVDIQTQFKEQLNKVVLQVLKSWDSADPTEYNVLSAVRTIRAISNSLKQLEEEINSKYLRKDIPDSAAELITFLDGMEVVGEALIDRLVADNGAIFRDTLSSEKFISGFPAGTGWAIMWKEVLNAIGVKEHKAIMELDEITVRSVMRIYEMIISQVYGENGTRLTTDSMKVASIDPEAKKIYLDTEKGILYNPFRAGDILMVQRYGGLPTPENGYNVTKYYELLVEAAGVGSDTDGENRLDWISYQNFTGNITDVAARDVLVRADNDRDSDRKGIIKQTSIEPGSPYMDIIYGMKTDPDNAVRTRLGRLSGIINRWWGQLKGYGLYSDNAYLMGEFRLKTGDDVRTLFEIVDGMLRSAMQTVTYNLNEEDNFLANATFTRDMEYWSHESDISLYSFDDQLLDMGYNFYSEKNSVSEVVEHDGRQKLRLKDGKVKQLNTYIRKPDPGSIMFLSFRYICESAGTLKTGFSGTAAGGDFAVREFAIKPNTDSQVFEISGEWDGSGDFVLEFTGDIYIESLNYSNKPLDDYKREVSTLFEQTDEYIKAVAKEINNLDNYVKTAGWITTADGHKLWATHETVDALGNRLTTHESSFHVTAEYIQGMVTRIDKVEEDYTWLDSYVHNAGWITTADGNRLWATITRVDLLGNQITTHASSFHVTATQISSMVSSIDTINGTIKSAGWITKDTGNTLWAKKELENGNTIVSYINQTATTVTISASRVNLVGYVTASTISTIDIYTSRLYVSNGATIGSFRVDNSSLYWSSGSALIRLGYAGYNYQNSCIYARSDFGGNAIVGISSYGGAAIYGSCRTTQTMPSYTVLWAGYFDGNVCIQNANLFVYGTIQANSVLPQNAWSGRYKGKTVTVVNGIITNVS